MSVEIPFYFVAVPRYFFSENWFRNPKTAAFVVWTFSRCTRDKREVIHDNQKIVLQPFSFIFGRRRCVLETGLTEDEVRTQVKRFEKAGLLEKCPNKTPKRFTLLKWVTEGFWKDLPQENPQQSPKRPPTKPHNKEERNIRIKEKEPKSLDDDIDFPKENIIDFSSNQEDKSFEIR